MIDMIRIDGWQTENLKEGNKLYAEYVQATIALNRLESEREQELQKLFKRLQERETRK